jgi:ABC-type Co2+ transport system permease subunit
MGKKMVKIPDGKTPPWVWDVVGAAFFLVVWVVTSRQALSEGATSVSPAIPGLLLAYGLYRVIRRLVTGSAYPEPKPGANRYAPSPGRKTNRACHGNRADA